MWEWEISFKDTKGEDTKIRSLEETNPTQTAISRNLRNIWGQFNSFLSFEYDGGERQKASCQRSEAKSQCWFPPSISSVACCYACQVWAGLWTSGDFSTFCLAIGALGWNTYDYAWLYGVLGIQTQVLKLVQQVYPISYPPSQSLKLWTLNRIYLILMRNC